MKKAISILLSCSLILGSSFSAFGIVDYENTEVIKAVQAALNEEGFDCGTPDGIAGSGTKAAISDYRSKNNLPEGEAIDEDLLSSLGYINKDDDTVVDFVPATAEQTEALQTVAVSMAVAIYPILTDLHAENDNPVFIDYGNVSVFGEWIYVTVKISTDIGKTLIADCVYDESASYPWEVLYIYDFDDGHCYYAGGDNYAFLYDYKTGLLKERRKKGTDDPVVQEDVDIEFYPSVPNDTTGRWRLSIVDTDKPINSYIVNYYNQYFKADNEIHAIINKHDNTTAAVSSFGDMLYVHTHQYSPGEENDARVLFGGKLLSEKYYDKETGQETSF